MACHIWFEPVLNCASLLNQQSLQTLPIVVSFPQRQSPSLCLEATNLAKDPCCLSAHLEHLVRLEESFLLPQSWHKLFALRYRAIFLDRSLHAERQVSQNKIPATAGLPQRIHKPLLFLSNCNFEYPIISLKCYHFRNIISRLNANIKGGGLAHSSPALL